MWLCTKNKLTMEYFENTKFSHYQFSNEEMENMYDENKERTSFSFIQYIICADGCSNVQADIEIKNLKKLLDSIKANPNYSYLNFRLVYVKNNIGSIEYYNPMLIVDKDTWMFVKGMMVGSYIKNIPV